MGFIGNMFKIEFSFNKVLFHKIKAEMAPDVNSKIHKIP